MNVLFIAVFLASSAAVLLSSPESFLPALLSGAEDALRLGVTLAAVYTVWLGFLKIAEDAGLMRALARGLRPATSRLFGTKDERALGYIAVNLSANFYRCCQTLDAQAERNLVYAMVNTLTELDGIKTVQFYIEGEVVDVLTQNIYIKAPLMRNPGLIN